MSTVGSGFCEASERLNDSKEICRSLNFWLRDRKLRLLKHFNSKIFEKIRLFVQKINKWIKKTMAILHLPVIKIHFKHLQAGG